MGPSRYGKTQWARSLGRHAYIANMWDLSAFDSLSDDFYRDGYVVFDDINWDTIKSSAKSWFGAQRDFSVCDKYRQKKRILGGIPCIYLCNPDAYRDDLFNFVRGDWGIHNITVVELTEKLYEENQEPNPTPNPVIAFGGYRS